jgi:hypothetical protein
MNSEHPSSDSDVTYEQALAAVERDRAIRHELVGSIDKCQQMLYLLQRTDDNERRQQLLDLLSEDLRAMRDCLEQMRFS